MRNIVKVSQLAKINEHSSACLIAFKRFLADVRAHSPGRSG